MKPSRRARGTRNGSNGQAAHEQVAQVPIASIRPSPENDGLYRPIDERDPDFKSLVQSVRKSGILEPLIITADGYIVSGHRRHAAAKAAGLATVPVRRLSIRREDDADAFVRLLREHNRQRIKTRAELLREAIVETDPEAAHKALEAHRAQNPDMSGFDGLEVIDFGDRRNRSRISDAKKPMLEAVQRIVEEHRRYWPLSDRQIHYALLNDAPLRHAAKPGSRYQNDPRSYGDLTDLLTRARLFGLIPWAAIGDETRPVMIWDVFTNVQPYLRRELDNMFTGYYRDLQQGQPNHVEIVAEKLTVKGILRPIAARYCIPLTIGRGFCSIDPRYRMAQRFRKSGRQRLVVLLISDHDPDGEGIAESFAASLRDDFGITDARAVKVALTRDQVNAMKLPPKLKAKTTSSRYGRFAKRHGEDAYELEAIPPQELQRLLDEAIRQVIDIDLFNKEVEAERKDAAVLDACREHVRDELMDYLDEADEAEEADE